MIIIISKNNGEMLIQIFLLFISFQQLSSKHLGTGQKTLKIVRVILTNKYNKK